MSFVNAVETLKEAVELVAEKKGDYLVELKLAASEVENYLSMRGDEDLELALTEAVVSATDDRGDYLSELESIMDELETLTS